MTEQDYRLTLLQIHQLARDWQGCHCAGSCVSCIDRICEIEELAETALRPGEDTP